MVYCIKAEVTREFKTKKELMKFVHDDETGKIVDILKFSKHYWRVGRLQPGPDREVIVFN